MSEELSKTRQITLGINVPAYCTVEVPPHVGESEEELKAFAESLLEDWWTDGDALVFDPEWGNAIRETERIVSVTEEEGGKVLRHIAEDLPLEAPPAGFEAVAGAEHACRAGLRVLGCLMASTAHMTPEESHTFACESSPVRGLNVTGTAQDGCFLEIDEAFFAEDADLAVLLEFASEGLRGVVERAVVYGLRMVRFGAQGPIIEGVPTAASTPGPAP